MDSSAVRFACIDVTPKVSPSTATTSSAEARKIFAVSPNAGLVALASGIGRIVLAELVAMPLPAVTPPVQGDLQRLVCAIAGRDLLNDFRRNAPMPDMEPIGPWRHVCEPEASVRAGLREIPVRHDLDVSDHPRMNVAEHAHQARMRERLAPRRAAAVEPQVKRIRFARGKDIVVERIVVGKAHR